MNDINKTILSIINKVKLRLTIKRLLSYMLKCITFGIMVCILVSIISHLMPITFIYTKFMYIILFSIFIGGVYSFLNRPDKMHTAKIIDSNGLKERTVTALELMESDNPYSRMEIKDTYDHLKMIDYRKLVSYKPGKKRIVVLFTLCVCLIIISNIPNKNEDIVAQKEKVHIIKEEENKEIQKLEKEIENDNYLTDDQKEELVKELAQLNKEISKIDDEKKFVKQAESNKKIIEHKKNEEKEKNFEKMANKMLQNDKLKKLAQNLNDKDFDKAKEEIENLIQETENMSDKEYEDMLADISDKLQGIDVSDLEDALGELTDDMQLTAQQLANSQYELAKNSNSNNATGNNNNNTDGQNTSPNSSQENGPSSGESDGQGSGQGNGQSSKDSDGQGNIPGNGNRNGEGKGTGSANNDADNKPLDASTEDKYVNGQQGDKNSSIEMTKEGISIGGEKISYDQVIGEYQNKAYESMNGSEIPKGMQQVIKEYFSGLN